MALQRTPCDALHRGRTISRIAPVVAHEIDTLRKRIRSEELSARFAAAFARREDRAAICAEVRRELGR